MNRITKILLATAVVVLCGVAFWLLRPTKQVTPQVAPVAQIAAPVASLPDAPFAAQASGVGQPTAHSVAPSTPVPAKTLLASPAATPHPEPPAQTPASPSTLAPPSSTPSAPAAELAATVRMYAAHASLRTPEVSDPDSKSNKQILQTMVTKMLAQPATPPPAVASSTTR